MNTARFCALICLISYSYCRRVVQVVTVASDVNVPFCNFVRSVLSYGYSLNVISYAKADDPRLLMADKPKLLLKLMQDNENFKNDSIVVFADGYDVIVQHDVDKFYSKYQELGSPELLFSGESYCFPFRVNKHVTKYCSVVHKMITDPYGLLCGGKMRSMMPETRCANANQNVKVNETLSLRVVFPFINTGIFLGKVNSLMSFLHEYLDKYDGDPSLRVGTDQGIVHEVFLSKSPQTLQGVVDKRSSIFLNLCCPRSPLKQYVTFRREIGLSLNINDEEIIPVFLHWPGHAGEGDANYLSMKDMKRTNINLRDATFTDNLFVHGNTLSKNEIVGKC